MLNNILRNRLKGAKIESIVTFTHIARFEYIVTDSELEALVLECNLIKEHRPKYNTMLKDDKSYPFIKVTVNEAFPRVLFARRMKKDKAKYFGPYTSAGAVKDVIELVQKLYHIRTCNRNLPEISERRGLVCYHIHQCHGPCQGKVRARTSIGARSRGFEVSKWGFRRYFSGIGGEDAVGF